MSKILLVEDNELSRDMLSRRLQRRGHTVLTANDGAQARELATSELPHLILMDIGLPDTDGWEVTKFLRATELTKRIPIIALTAHALVADRQKAFEVGCNDYDTKPVDWGRLTEKIDALLSARQCHEVSS